MLFKHNIKTAFRGLETNKSRSFLTVLGIVIGITSIILIMAIGGGAQNLILGQIQGLGSKSIVVLPGREPKGLMDSAETMMSDSLKERDVEALLKKTNAPNIAKVMPIVFGSASAAYEGETYRLTIFGTEENAASLYDLRVSDGSFLTADDVKTRADVVVIGDKVRQELFGDSDALGQKIKMKGRNFRVVGILNQKGAGSLINFDEAAFVPYTTAQYYLFGIKHYHRLVIEADREENINQTVKDIEATLRNTHGITDPDKDDFYVQTQADLVNTISMVTNILTLFLAAVAAISLLVGGIGIMNIMLVSVTERTREIGLRKALGATSRNILSQFLLEAMLLTLAGGIIGILLGSSLAFLVSLVLSKVLGVAWGFSFPVSAALLGVGVAAFVGLVFGLYPARQASKKSPIEALRYE